MLENLDGVETKYFIQGREVGTKKDLEKEFGCTAKTITRYIKQGMPEHPQSTPRFKVFDVEECKEWKNININTEQSKRASTKKEDSEEDESYSSEESSLIWDGLSDKQRKQIANSSASLRKTVADANKAEEDAVLAKLKRLEKEELLVDANDLDKAMAEQAILHRTDKTNDEKVLPVILENKTSQEITSILHAHNQDRLKLLDSLVNKQFRCKETVFDVFETILQKLKEKNPKEIKKCVSDM